MNKLIDTHAYIGSNDILRVEEKKPEIYYDLRREVIQKFNYSPMFLLMTYSIGDNFQLPQIISENPDLFLGGILQINPNRLLEKIVRYSSPAELETMIKSGSIVGLKLHTSAVKTRVDDESLDEFSRLALDYDIPMVFHCSATGQKFAHPDYFRRLKDRHPNLKMVLAHYAGLYEEFIPGYIELIGEYPLIYLNTAGLGGEIHRWIFETDPPSEYYEDNPKRWTKIFLNSIKPIQDKVVFGSDYPELQFRLHPIDKADKEIQQKILFENPIKVFGLEDRV